MDNLKKAILNIADYIKLEAFIEGMKYADENTETDRSSLDYSVEANAWMERQKELKK